MRVRRLLPLLLILAAACGTPPVTEDVTLAFSKEGDGLVVTAETKFDLTTRSEIARARVSAARDAVIAGTDPWSIRFARTNPEREQVTWYRQHGVLERVVRTANLPADDLQRLFADASVTVNVLRGEGWRELALYPGTSGRATREQQRQFDSALTEWSRGVALYFQSVRHLYAYLDENPHRAEPVFAALFEEKERDPALALTEDEGPLLEAVLNRMEVLARRMDAQNDESAGFAEVADLIFNPFPARITVRLPVDVIAVEGFVKRSANEVGTERIDLLEAIAKLEGRWINPDPLAIAMRDETPAPAALAKIPRDANTVIDAGTIAQALRKELEMPRTYVVRWRE